MRTAFLAAALLWLASPAGAAPITCEELQTSLSGGLILGTGPAYDPRSQLKGVIATHRDFCVPAGLQLGTAEAVFVHWLFGATVRNSGLNWPPVLMFTGMIR